MIRVYIEHLVANAFIAYLTNTNPRNLNRRLSLKQIERFGNEVVHKLQLKGKNAVIVLSKDLTDLFFDKYSDIYTLIDDDIVVLNDDVTIDYLIDNFTGYLCVDLITEFGKRNNYKILVQKT